MGIQKLIGVAISVSVVWIAIIIALFMYKSTVFVMCRNRHQEPSVQPELYSTVFDIYSN